MAKDIIYLGNIALPAARLAASAPERPNWDENPLMRWLEFRFLTTTIWKQVALPWREAMVDQARKSSQIRNQRWPYLALMVSPLPSQLRYQRQRVPE